MKEVVGEVRNIHPEVIKHIGLDGAIALLRVAHALRTGQIESKEYDQMWLGIGFGYGDYFIQRMKKCNSACCIFGWARAFTTPKAWHRIKDRWAPSGYISNSEVMVMDRLGDLFNAYHPSNPQKAANAIEAFIYDYAERPWGIIENDLPSR